MSQVSRQLSEKERRWKQLADRSDSPSATGRRRYRCKVSGCGFEKLVQVPYPASEYAHRLFCEWCHDIVPMYPIGGRSLEAIRNKPRRKL